MENVLLYLGLFILSLVSCFIGFYEEGVRGNICHIKNGREANAGVALFPTIPVIPIVYFGVVYGLNHLKSGLGWYAISGWFLMLGAYWLYMLPKLNKEFNRLIGLRSKS